MDIGDRIKELRESKGMLQKELGEKIGVKKESINQYEANKVMPKKETLIKLKEILNTSLDYLITGKELEKTEGTEIQKIFNKLNVKNKGDVIEYAEMKLKKQEEDSALESKNEAI